MTKYTCSYVYICVRCVQRTRGWCATSTKQSVEDVFFNLRWLPTHSAGPACSSPTSCLAMMSSWRSTYCRTARQTSATRYWPIRVRYGFPTRVSPRPLVSSWQLRVTWCQRLTMSSRSYHPCRSYPAPLTLVCRKADVVRSLRTNCQVYDNFRETLIQ